MTEGVGRMSAEGLVERYSAELGVGDARTRLSAARVLGELRDRRATGPLVSALQDPEADVRSEAARALGTLRDVEAADALDTVLKTDADVAVRTAAATALGAMADRA